MAAAVQSSTNLFRRLAWSATVPLEIRLAEATGPVDRYFIQAPRYTYLCLLLPSIREHLVELALDDDALARTNESEWWFELDASESPFSSDAVRWHWPLDLVDLHAAILRPVAPTRTLPLLPPSSSSSSFSSSLPTSSSASALSALYKDPAPMASETPLRLVLHLTGAPSDKLVIGPSLDAAKTHFTAQIKEADFVRWGNTKRVTSLRRTDLEAGWEGVVSGDYETHHKMAGKIVPLPVPISPDAVESAYAARSLPIKLYLPDGAPPVQLPMAPLTDGRPTTLIQMLGAALPLLFNGDYRRAQPIAQGILLPPESEVAWLAACMAGADGWLRIGVRLVAE